MTVGAVYQVKMYTGGSTANEVLNVFHYEQTVGADTAASALFVAFRDEVVANLAPIISNTLEITTVSVASLPNPTDFYTDYVYEPGTRVTDMSTAFLAWGFQYLSARSDARSGSKRFCGVAEGDQSNGQPSVNALILLTLLGSKLAATISSGGKSFKPVILGVRSGGVTLEKNPISGVSFTRVTTQNTRKK